MNTITVIENARSKSRHAFRSTERHSSQQLAKYFVAIVNYDALIHNKKIEEIIARRREDKAIFKESLFGSEEMLTAEDTSKLEAMLKKEAKLNTVLNLIANVSSEIYDVTLQEKNILSIEINKLNIKKINHEKRKELVEQFDREWGLSHLDSEELMIFNRGKLPIDHFNWIAAEIPINDVPLEKIIQVVDAGIILK